MRTPRATTLVVRGWDGSANVACFSAVGAALDAFYTITYASLVSIIG